MQNTQEMTKEQLEQQLINTQAVADILANKVAENEKFIAQLQVANQVQAQLIKQLQSDSNEVAK